MKENMGTELKEESKSFYRISAHEYFMTEYTVASVHEGSRQKHLKALQKV
jgi:hypothetical protein